MPALLLGASSRSDLRVCDSPRARLWWLFVRGEEELALIILQRNFNRIRKYLQRVLLRSGRDGRVRDALLRAAAEERARVKRRVEVEGALGQV